MAQKWYQKASVQQALVGGLFLVAAATISAIITLSLGPPSTPVDSTPQVGGSDRVGAESDLHRAIGGSPLGRKSVSDAPDNWTKEQLQVWKVIMASEEAVFRRDPNWAETYLHPEYSAWSSRLSMPFNRQEVKEGLELDWRLTKTEFYKNTPVRIIIHKETAVIHFTTHLIGVELNDGKSTERQVRETAILVKDSGDWLKLTSHISDF